MNSRDLNEKQQTEILRLGFPALEKAGGSPPSLRMTAFIFLFFSSPRLRASAVKKQKTGAFSPENLRRLLPQFRGLRPLISLFGLTYEFGPLRPRIHNDVS